jgi:monoamine oxidase
MIPTWWPQSPLKTPILTGWAGGSKAESLMQHTDEELLEIAASSLCNIFNIEPAILRNNIISSNVYNCQKYDESLGAYSYSTPLSKSARKLLNTPLAETVFFAGEGVFDGDQSGIVESALLSGRQAAHKLLKLLG